MGDSMFWVTDNAPVPPDFYSTTDQNFDQTQNTETFGDNYEEQTLNDMEVVQSEIPVDGRVSELFYSDSDSDGVDVKIGCPELLSVCLHQQINKPNFLPITLGINDFVPFQQPFYFSNSAPAVQSDYQSHQDFTDTASVSLSSKPKVWREGSDDSISLLGRPVCAVCKENPCNTCIMHHLDLHIDLCYSCALSHFARGSVCPLCSDRILYIYMYDDI